jgi:DNA-binding NarL/FixJ family response regulator
MVIKASPNSVIVIAAANLHRLAWSALLGQQPGLVVRGAAATPDELQGMAETPVTLLVDMAPLQPELVRHLAAAAPQATILCLIDHNDVTQIVGLLQAGATGCLSRHASAPELALALIAVARGEIVLPPELAIQALTALTRSTYDQAQPTESLSERETEVLRLLAQGLSNKDIAQSLFLSVRTVEAHLRNIYSKLAIASRTEAVLWAVNHGYGG